MIKCMRRPLIKQGDHETRCPHDATYVYAYLGMPLCDECTGVMRHTFRRAGWEPSKLLVRIENYEGELANGS